jgi:hypothetical protein
VISRVVFAISEKVKENKYMVLCLERNDVSLYAYRDISVVFALQILIV